jgi:hypothetical protein
MKTYMHFRERKWLGGESPGYLSYHCYFGFGGYLTYYGYIGYYGYLG